MLLVDPKESAVKLALDNAELVELRPALQRKATAANFDDSGGLVLVLPHDLEVIAFIQELAEIQYAPADLKTARRRLRVARQSYQTRVAHRVAQNLDGPVFNRFVSLSAILIARAEAMHWNKVVRELEYTDRTTKHNRAAIEKGKRIRAGLAIGAAIKKVVTP